LITTDALLVDPREWFHGNDHFILCESPAAWYSLQSAGSSLSYMVHTQMGPTPTRTLTPKTIPAQLQHGIGYRELVKLDSFCPGAELEYDRCLGCENSYLFQHEQSGITLDEIFRRGTFLRMTTF
jgi:hypothetical protein